MQTSLKPVLANLAFYYMLDLRVLRALAHLLKHLCTWFNVTLGAPPPSAPAFPSSAPPPVSITAIDTLCTVRDCHLAALR